MVKADQIVFKRKYRWVVWGEDSEGNIIFPRAYAKVFDRPYFPHMGVADENGGHLEYVPGELKVWQDFGQIHENTLEVSIRKIMECKNIRMELIDGCGDIVETWIFRDITVYSIDREPYEEYIAEWSFQYKSSDVIHSVVGNEL